VQTALLRRVLDHPSISVGSLSPTRWSMIVALRQRSPQCRTWHLNASSSPTFTPARESEIDALVKVPKSLRVRHRPGPATRHAGSPYGSFFDPTSTIHPAQDRPIHAAKSGANNNGEKPCRTDPVVRSPMPTANDTSPSDSVRSFNSKTTSNAFNLVGNARVDRIFPLQFECNWWTLHLGSQSIS